MNGSLGHFKALVARRKERQSKHKKKFDQRKLNSISEQIAKEIEFPEVSKHKIMAIKKDIRSTTRRRRLKEVVVFLIILASLLFVFLKYIV